jgi:hypothetical protein
MTGCAHPDCTPSLCAYPGEDVNGCHGKRSTDSTISNGSKTTNTTSAVSSSPNVNLKSVDTPRAVVFLARDDQEEHLRHIQVVAGNRTPNGQAGETFRVEGVLLPELTEEVTLAVPLGASTKDVEDLLGNTRAAEPSRSDTARELVLDILDEEGAQESDALDARVSDELGLAAGTVRNQRADLHKAGLIRYRKETEDGHDKWVVLRTNAAR